MSIITGGLDTLGVKPAIGPESEPFWKAAAAGELVVEMCMRCGLHVFPPRGVCRRCHSREMDWVTLEPPGVIYSSTVNHNAWAPDVDAVYAIALVEFPRFSGVRFVGFVDGFDGEPPIDALVDYGFHVTSNGLHRLHFTPWTDR
jgi:uncharacterized OB-fold protein